MPKTLGQVKGQQCHSDIPYLNSQTWTWSCERYNEEAWYDFNSKITKDSSLYVSQRLAALDGWKSKWCLGGWETSRLSSASSSSSIRWQNVMPRQRCLEIRNTSHMSLRKWWNCKKKMNPKEVGLFHSFSKRDGKQKRKKKKPSDFPTLIRWILAILAWWMQSESSSAVPGSGGIADETGGSMHGWIVGLYEFDFTPAVDSASTIVVSSKSALKRMLKSEKRPILSKRGEGKNKNEREIMGKKRRKSVLFTVAWQFCVVDQNRKSNWVFTFSLFFIVACFSSLYKCESYSNESRPLRHF